MLECSPDGAKDLLNELGATLAEMHRALYDDLERIRLDYEDRDRRRRERFEDETRDLIRMRDAIHKNLAEVEAAKLPPQIIAAKGVL